MAPGTSLIKEGDANSQGPGAKWTDDSVRGQDTLYPNKETRRKQLFSLASPSTDLTWPQTPPPDLCVRLPAQIPGCLPPSRPGHSPFSRGTLLSLLRQITSGYHRDPQATSPEAQWAPRVIAVVSGRSLDPLNASFRMHPPPTASSPEATEPNLL